MDFDGVIADSKAQSLATTQKICARRTLELHDLRFESNINDADKPELSEDHGPDCQHDLNWWDAYRPIFDSVGIFNGMREASDALAANYGLAIVSSTISELIEEFLKKHGMRGAFIEILGNEVHTSKVEKMRMIFEKYGKRADDCVFITDTLGDMREAKEHEMGAIGVSWGYHPHATLEKGIPFRIVDTPAELPDAVSDYFEHLYVRT